MEARIQLVVAEDNLETADIETEVECRIAVPRMVDNLLREGHSLAHFCCLRLVQLRDFLGGDMARLGYNCSLAEIEVEDNLRVYWVDSHPRLWTLG